MRSLFFFSSSPSSSSPSTPSSHSRRPSPPPQLSFSDSLMDDNFTTAQEIITKWDSDSSPYAKITSLFHENRQESRLFLKSVQELQQAMHFYVSVDSSSPKLVQAQTLMQMAMKRLEKEFYQILAANRDHLDPESISGKSSANTTVSSISDIEDEIGYEDEIQEAGDSIQEVERVSSLAMEDLRAIAECMISSGYGKECLKIYKIIRKSIVDEALYRLGFERMTAQQLQKLDWEVVDNKIRVWLHAVKISVKTLFSGERILCDHVFTASKTVAESCYSEIVKEAATGLFEFPELVTKGKKSPEKTFRFLDMYDAIAEIWPEIEATFSYESTSAVRAQAVNALIKLGESVRLMLADFESAIQKDSSKATVPGGGNHPLTRYVMNYVSFLSDYTAILADIFADWPLKVKSSFPETFLSDNSSSFSSENPISSISVRLAWIILVLLCKLDGKAELYKDAGLAYLFLANNLNYVVGKVKSSNLAAILGDEWVDKHEAKVKLYVGNYERMAWNKAISALPENPIPEISPEEMKEVFRKFNSAFEDTYRRHSGWVVPDSRLRDEIKLSLARKLIPKYREFYQMHRPILGDERGLTAVVRFAPEDLGNQLSDLFYGESVSGSATPSRGPR